MEGLHFIAALYIYLFGDRKKMVFGFEFYEVAMILSPITTSCTLIHVAALYLTCGLTLLTDISESNHKSLSTITRLVNCNSCRTLIQKAIKLEASFNTVLTAAKNQCY